MASISRFIIQRLKLQVNWRKSAVDRPWNRSFLGVQLHRWEAPQTPENCAEGTGSIQSAVKALTRRNQGHSLKHVIMTPRRISARVDWLF